MTDVAVRGAQTPSARAVPPSKAMKAGDFLAHSRDVLEAPFRLIDAAHAIKGPLNRDEIHAAGDPRVFAKASDWLARQQPRADIEAIHGSIARALAAPSDERLARLSLANLLEAYPNAGKETRETYFATLLHDVLDQGVGPFVLAEACKETRRNVRFLPTVSELLTIVTSVRYPARLAVDRLASVLDCFTRCEEIVSAHELSPSEWTDDLWWDALLAWGSCDYAVIWADRLGPPPGEPGCLVPSSVIERYRQARRGWGERRMAA